MTTTTKRTLTRAAWVCDACGRRGFILRSNLEDGQTAEWRRDQSHRVQTTHGRCPLPRLRWASVRPSAVK